MEFVSKLSIGPAIRFDQTMVLVSVFFNIAFGIFALIYVFFSWIHKFFLI